MYAVIAIYQDREEVISSGHATHTDAVDRLIETMPREGARLEVVREDSAPLGNTPELAAAAAAGNALLERWEDDEAWRDWLDSGAGGFI